MSSRVRIRGIYSIALGKLLSDFGFRVVKSSELPTALLNSEESFERCDIDIADKVDLQGIEATGYSEHVTGLFTFLREKLPDAVLMDMDSSGGDHDRFTAGIEFPGLSKKILDITRHSACPDAVERHHRLRIVDGSAVEAAERLIRETPLQKHDIERQLFRDAVLLPLERNGTVRLEHLRPSGESMRPREGVLTEIVGNRIVFKRTFLSGGQYDGLDLPIHAGDYCLTEAEEDSWFVKHAYFSKDGSLIGEYYNINTPVELYPFGIRYVDLEVDIVRRAGGSPEIIDREKLAFLVQRGSIGPELELKALSVVEHIMRQL